MEKCGIFLNKKLVQDATELRQTGSFKKYEKVKKTWPFSELRGL